uniref:Large ribosomal subunit protein uL24 n=1 Tax=uncultured Nitrospirae bacterium Rifle_16ft_4_minimus_4901 TaxID=1665132 RepID=A0A0H4TCR0_9BACT|nr:50S ribosomal protein L24, large subunit ribosomal protein L24 [uncultured Nitrospirae bacterium Rifle_16ft_4_minimus_4901]
MGMHIKKGDSVAVLTGKEKGKRGKIIKVLSSGRNLRVLIERINIIKKHMKPNAKNKEGGILEMEGPIEISNVSVVCPKCDKVTRTGIKITDEKKVRYCKKCKEIID